MLSLFGHGQLTMKHAGLNVIENWAAIFEKKRGSPGEHMEIAAGYLNDLFPVIFAI